jgi:6-phosphogluconolactonase
MMTQTTTHARTLVYISNADSREIYVLELNAIDGKTTLVEKVPVVGKAMPMAVSPDRRFLFAALRNDDNLVSTFAIDSTNGKLTLVGTSPLIDDMCYLATDRSGRFLMAASYSGNRFSVNAINAKGEVAHDPVAVLPTGKNAHAILADPSNQFIFVPTLGHDAIYQYRFDAKTGAVTANDPPKVSVQKGAGPRHLVFHPNRQFVFCVNELDGTVNTYRLSAQGTLTLLHSISVMPADAKGAKPTTADIHLTPDGRFLYTSERTTNTLAAFRVNTENGKLELVGHYSTEQRPRGFNIDPQGKYLLAVGQDSNRLSIYQIDQQTGSLRKLSEMEVGKNPNWVEIVTLPQ